MQKNEYPHGLTEAEDEYGNKVLAVNAIRGHKYYCLFCHTEMHVHTSICNRLFFERYQGAKQHSNDACISIIKDGICPRFDESGTPGDLIASIVSPAISKGISHNKSSSITSSPDNDDDDGDIKYVGFSSLKQMYVFIKYNRDPRESVGEYIVSDYIIHFAWMKDVFSMPDFVLGDRILQVGFWGYSKLADTYYLIFRGYKYDSRTSQVTFDIKFALATNDRTLFDRMLTKLKDSTDEKTGKVIKHQALIAGQNWALANRNHCECLCGSRMRENLRCNNCSGMYIARLYTKSAIYVAPNN